MEQSKLNTCQANFDTAVSFVKSELAKRSAGGTATDNVEKDLNSGNKKDPYVTTKPAFISTGTPVTGATCQTDINVSDLRISNTAGASVGSFVKVTSGGSWPKGGGNKTTSIKVE